jgi:hypothetical protein
VVISVAIAAIFIPITFFAREGPLILSVSILSISVLIICLILYVTFAGRKMSYELGEEEFKVNFGLMKFKTQYSVIDKVQISPVTLLLRIFGGSWPGLHWGLFQSDIGRVHVYSTRRKGDFILMSLVDGKKIVLSPEEPENFLDDINNRRKVSLKPDVSDLKLFEVSKKVIYSQVLIVLLAYLLVLAYVQAVYPSLPEVIPVHFDFNWNPNRWAPKTEILIITGVVAIFPVINTILAIKFGKYGRYTLLFLGAIFIAAIALFHSSIQTIVSLSLPNV